MNLEKVKPDKTEIFYVATYLVIGLAMMAILISFNTSMPKSLDAEDMPDCLSKDIGEPKVCYATWDIAEIDSGYPLVITVQTGWNKSKVRSNWHYTKQIFRKESEIIN